MPTIRELGGEIWSELRDRVSEDDVDWRTKNVVVDIVMGVLARHDGKLIVNDKDIPVNALEESDSSEVKLS